MKRKAPEGTGQVEREGLDSRDGHPLQPGRVSTGWRSLHCKRREVAFIPKDSKYESLDQEWPPRAHIFLSSNGLSDTSRAWLVGHSVIHPRAAIQVSLDCPPDSSPVVCSAESSEQCISSVRGTVAREVRVIL